MHLAVALDGAGWHPAAWRSPEARPTELFTAGYWADQLAEAERGLLDFVTLDDSLTLQSSDHFRSDQRTDQVRGRLDAVLTAARIAPTSQHIGIVPTATVVHTEPFHLSKAIATLDYVSSGRAGVQIRVGGHQGETTLFGRREIPPVDSVNFDQVIGELFDEAAEYIEVIRRLWDSWSDDAEIRDAATGRFIDRDKLHYIDFEGRFFSVKGPSITPRPPQGQPLVTALAHQRIPYRLAARQADLVFVTPTSDEHARNILAEVAEETRQAQRSVQVFADLLVVLDDHATTAERRLQKLDALAGSALTSDARVFVGSPGELADELGRLSGLGFDGFRLRPAEQPYDLARISRDLVPELQRRGSFREQYREKTLRERLGLPRPVNRYEAA